MNVFLADRSMNDGLSNLFHQKALTKDGFTPFILSLAACLGKLDLETVRAALSTCSKKQVKAWATTNVGDTIYSQRRRLFNPFSWTLSIYESNLDICAVAALPSKCQDWTRE